MKVRGPVVVDPVWPVPVPVPLLLSVPLPVPVPAPVVESPVEEPAPLELQPDIPATATAIVDLRNLRRSRDMASCSGSEPATASMETVSGSAAPCTATGA